MKLNSNHIVKGYTLTEVLLAISVMAVALPLILGLVVAGGESSRQAEWETRSVITARSVYEELRRAANNNGEFLTQGDLPWPTGVPSNITGAAGGAFGGAFGGGAVEEEDDGWLILELDKDGRIIGHAADTMYEDAWEGDNVDVASLAAVRGKSQEIENVELAPGVPLNIFRIEVRIESPARAEVENRERIVFIRSDSLR